MSSGPRTNDDGSLSIRPRVTIPADEIELRVTTSGGPGGQHANRSLTRVVASFHVDASSALSDHDKQRLAESLGPVVRSSASRFRSQGQNRRAALDQLANKLAVALTPRTPRRATKPTKGAVVRRVNEKKLRGRLKEQRRRPVDD
ncbi:MAG TPA: alternative ribosome rescue aminoacyl-tRNA hydrolase ArfB [Acidimicrobiales bacterium]|nr:alternative ribosome rescue aminoacyl-tRNA hydrolase ArfB [Acidimicrobiales bacterium]